MIGSARAAGAGRDGEGGKQVDRAALNARWHEEGYYGTETLRDRLAAGAEKYGDHKLVVWSPYRPDATTLGALHIRGVELGGALAGRGIGTGDVVAFQMPNWIEAAAIYHACTELGAVVLPIIHIYGVPEVSYILEESGAKALVTPTEWGSIDFRERHLDSVDLRIFVGDGTPAGAVAFETLEADGTEDYERGEVSADDVHILTYTSGTTSYPKGVRHSHNSLLHETKQLNVATGARPDDVFLSPNPVGHMAGILSGLLNPYLYGEHMIMMDGWDPAAAVELIAEHRVTRSGGAPFFLSTLLDAVEATDADLSSMRFFGCGGAGVSPSLMERADAVGWLSHRSYGSTEHPSVTAGWQDDPLEKRAYTDGRALPGVEISVRDEDGRAVERGDVGEVCTRGPDMFLGYTRADLDAEAFTEDGFYRSGDLGFVDSEGFLTITDRIKDIIIRGGENISAKEVEDVLVSHDKVQEAAATAMPDEKYGERVCAFVVCPGEELTFQEMQAHFDAAGIAKQKWPERLEIVADFPRTLAGKVKKYRLRESLWA